MGAQEAYWLSSGLNSIGQPWLDPTQNNRPTRWPVAGDPITGTGWIEALTWPGGDCYMSVHAGPFDLETNQPYTFLVAHIVGLGKDYLNSIAVMKNYARSIRTTAALDFKKPAPPPAPIVKIGPLDTLIVLSWDDRMIDYKVTDHVHLDSTGQPTQYAFQGFKLYQGTTAAGPWKIIQQWDLDDGITRIWDYVADFSWGELLYLPVEDGKDTGLTWHTFVTKDYLNNSRLIRGKAYYFALTGYAYNPQGIPKVLENEIQCLTAIPQRPVLNTVLQSLPADTLAVTHTGSGDGQVVAQVIDPHAITGHEYRLTFKKAESGQITWDVFDVNTGWYVLNHQARQIPINELAADEAFPVIDGLLIKVSSPPPGMKRWEYQPSANRWLTWTNGDLYRLEGFSGAIGWGANFLNGSATPAERLRNVELRFAATDETGAARDPNDPNISLAYRYLRHSTATPAKAEFTSFIIHQGAGYVYQDWRPICVAAYNIEVNPPQRLALAFLENNAAGGLVDGRWFPPRSDTEGGNNTAREMLYIFESDYAAAPKDEYTRKNLLDDAASMDLMWVVTASRRSSQLPQAGDKLILYANHVNSVDDIFTIKTSGYEKQSSLEIARRRLNEIQVFPNPYFGINPAERSAAEQFVTFSNLPEKCIVRIFSLSGQMVRSLLHDNATPFERWDLKNEHGRTVGSGLYVVYIHIDEVGERLIKLAIIDRE